MKKNNVSGIFSGAFQVPRKTIIYLMRIIHNPEVGDIC